MKEERGRVEVSGAETKQAVAQPAVKQEAPPEGKEDVSPDDIPF